MIVTHTSNPSIDYYMLISEELEMGIHRSERYSFLPGGKGLNVSMLLSRMGIPSVATAFLGGFSGDYIRREIEKYPAVTLDMVEVEEPSRINVKLRGKGEVDINAKGPLITEAHQQEMLEKLEALREGDWFLICGSLAKGVEENFLIQAAERVRTRKARLVLDVPGLKADLLGRLRPALIKPNVEELYDLFGCGEEEATVAKLIEELQAMGVEAVLLSKGGDGAEYYGPDGIYQVRQPTLQAVNTVGAGDSMLAAFVGILDSGADLEEALRTAAAAGAATAVSEGLAAAELVRKHKEAVTVTRVRAAS